MDNKLNAKGDATKCPYLGGILKEGAGGGSVNRDWWPNQLNLNILRQHSSYLIQWMRILITQKNLKS